MGFKAENGKIGREKKTHVRTSNCCPKGQYLFDLLGQETDLLVQKEI